MSSSNKTTAPVKDPYDVLDVAFGASASEISKAYRQLARTLHPDKLVAQNLTDAELAKAAIRFQDIQIARSFLLDVEYAESRRVYDVKQASNRLRRAADLARDAGMTDRRKRMRDQLKVHEEQAANSKRHKAQRATAATANKDELERQGRALREQYGATSAANELQERNVAVVEIQERQIRLKWSRKNLKAAGQSSPSEDTIAKMLSRSCGTVVGVQMIGGKGNIALATFHDESSCSKAVESYSTSSVWRATYVSKFKQRAQDELTAQQQQLSTDRFRDQEDVRDWKVRQAAEREAHLRQIERDDDDDFASSRQPSARSSSVAPFPPPFPMEYAAQSLAIDKLEMAEDILLSGILSGHGILQIKIARKHSATDGAC